MKTILKSIFLVLTLFLFSCNKDEAVASPPPPGLPELLYAEGGETTMTAVTNPIALASSKRNFW